MIDGLKPYPAYQATAMPWLEKIPAHWKVEPGFAAYREKQQRNIGMIERRVLSLSYGRIVIKPTDKLHGLVPESFETYQIVDPGDIIIRSTDLQNDWTSLRVGLVRDRGIITSAYLCLKMVGPLIPEYGYLQLHTLDLMKVFYGMGSGLRQNLAFPDFKRMPVLVPRRDEQDSIVRFLDYAARRVERYIRTKKKLIALLTEQKQVIVHQTVTRGLDPNVRLKPSSIPWLGEIPEHWETISLGAASELIQTGPFGSQLHSHEYVESGIPVINPSHLRNGRIVPDISITIHQSKASELERHKLRVGDIVAARRGELGRCGLVTATEQGWICGTGSLRICCKRSLYDPAYLVWLFSSQGVRDSLSLSSIGATMDNLNAGMVARLRLPLPPLDEQHRVVQLIGAEESQSDSAVSTVKREIVLIREYRTRLVADVVTGQLDVREAAAKLPEASKEEDVELVEKENGEEGEPSEFEDMADSSTIA